MWQMIQVGTMKHFKVLVLVWLFCHGVPPCYGQINILLEPTHTLLQGRCPEEVVTLTCTTRGSPILAWKSDEYIGTGGAQLEFAGVNIVGDTESSPRYPTTVATLTDKSPASNELTSTLRITLSAEFQRASVKCVNVGTGEMIDATISLLDDSEALSRVKSVLRREGEICAVDLLWDLPSNLGEQDVSHFTVRVNDEETNAITQPSTSYTRCFCEPHNVTISITDRCGRTGSSTSVISFDSVQPLFDECATNATTNNEGSGFNVNDLNVLHIFIALICVSSVTLVLFGILSIICCRCMYRQCCKHNNKHHPENSSEDGPPPKSGPPSQHYVGPPPKGGPPQDYVGPPPKGGPPQDYVSPPPKGGPPQDYVSPPPKGGPPSQDYVSPPPQADPSPHDHVGPPLKGSPPSQEHISPPPEGGSPSPDHVGPPPQTDPAPQAGPPPLDGGKRTPSNLEESIPLNPRSQQPGGSHQCKNKVSRNAVSPTGVSTL